MRYQYGDKVHFRGIRDEEDEFQNGIVKWQSDEFFVFVVYECNNDWENFDKYTGESTFVDNLKRGWLNEKGEKI